MIKNHEKHEPHENEERETWETVQELEDPEDDGVSRFFPSSDSRVLLLCVLSAKISGLFVCFVGST